MIAAVPTVFSRQVLSVTLLMNNINSIRRESPGNKSLYEATTDKSIFRLMELMELHRIPADEINLTPTLLKI